MKLSYGRRRGSASVSRSNRSLSRLSGPIEHAVDLARHDEAAKNADPQAWPATIEPVLILFWPNEASSARRSRRPHFGQTKPAGRNFYALGAWPCVASRAPVEGPPEENEMGRTFAAFVVAASLLAVASSEASAWVCFATGLGSSGRARSYDIIDAKLFALRRCERNSPVPICTLLWCRPGG
jgi:hypothetical protein